MRPKRLKRSSVLQALAAAPRISAEELEEFMCDLANTRDDKGSLVRLRRTYEERLMSYSINELVLYRDELRLLWHPENGIPDVEHQAFRDWLKVRPEAEPGEMICSRWLGRSTVGLLAVWQKDRRELIPSVADLPAILVYGCLLFGDRLSYCQNPECSNPWFISARRDQQYCSNVCAWPAKKAAKRKWWAENRVKKLPVASERKAR
jgi:hypothetical protein